MGESVGWLPRTVTPRITISVSTRAGMPGEEPHGAAGTGRALTSRTCRGWTCVPVRRAEGVEGGQEVEAMKSTSARFQAERSSTNATCPLCSKYVSFAFGALFATYSDQAGSQIRS